MTEKDNRKYDKRIIFPTGKQKDFLIQSREALGVSWPEIAKIANVHHRTICDWRRERYSMQYRAAKKIEYLSKVSLPKEVEIKDPFWYSAKGSDLGWRVVLERYGYIGGDPEYRKQRWREWWEKEGKYNPSYIVAAKNIRKPKVSKKLAEFVGIIMGDGGLTSSQLHVSCNSRDDREYAFFVKDLIESLFDVPVSIRHPKDNLVMILVVSRKKLIEFCNQKLGLHIGNKLKQGLDIPPWIKQNVNFQKACVRGLFDTDGCLFYERHKINGKVYSYQRLNFTSASPQLRESVYLFLKQFGFSSKIRNNRCVQIEDKNEIKRYFNIIGTHNPKHLRRFMEEYR
jgi:DNA-binding XRE family transcriptional regulator